MAIIDSRTWYDVFISHSSRWPIGHRKLVDALADLLSQENLKVFLDRTELTDGLELLDSLKRAIKVSKTGLVVLTHKALASPWVELEIRLMQSQSLSGRFHMMAVRLEQSCRVPEGIQARDVFDLQSPSQLVNIVVAIKKAAGK
jgi:hypothetical protein